MHCFPDPFPDAQTEAPWRLLATGPGEQGSHPWGDRRGGGGGGGGGFLPLHQPGPSWCCASCRKCLSDEAMNSRPGQGAKEGPALPVGEQEFPGLGAAAGRCTGVGVRSGGGGIAQARALPSASWDNRTCRTQLIPQALLLVDTPWARLSSLSLSPSSPPGPQGEGQADDRTHESSIERNRGSAGFLLVSGTGKMPHQRGKYVGGYCPAPIVSSPSLLPYLPMFPSPIPLPVQGPLFSPL